MATYTGDKRLFLTEDRSKVVNEGDPSAAFLLVAPGGEISAEDAERYGVKTGELPQPSALEREREGLAAAEARGAVEEARVRRQRVADLEADEKARKAPAANKARAGADTKGG